MSFINGYDGKITLNELLSTIASATVNDVTSVRLYDMSIGDMVTISAYVDVEGEEHHGTATKNYDKVTLTIEEC